MPRKKQIVPFSNIVNTTLKDYDHRRALFEALANADDAGATRVRVVVTADWLFVHNDALLTQDDWVALQERVYSSTKLWGHEEKIGRFGRGFLTFYGFGDVIVVHCGSETATFEPAETLTDSQIAAVETTALTTWANLDAGSHAGHPDSKPAQGTLFAIQLPKSAQSRAIVTTYDAHRLAECLLTEHGPYLILHTLHLSSVSVSVAGPNHVFSGNVTKEYSSNGHVKTRLKTLCAGGEEKEDLYRWALQKFDSCGVEGVEGEKGDGEEEEAQVEVPKKRKSKGKMNGDTTNKKRKTPSTTAAVCLSHETRGQTFFFPHSNGHYYCGLSIGQHTGTPLHVHKCDLQLDSGRCAIKGGLPGPKQSAAMLAWLHTTALDFLQHVCTLDACKAWNKISISCEDLQPYNPRTGGFISRQLVRAEISGDDVDDYTLLEYTYVFVEGAATLLNFQRDIPPALMGLGGYGVDLADNYELILGLWEKAVSGLRAEEIGPNSEELPLLNCETHGGVCSYNHAAPPDVSPLTQRGVFAPVGSTCLVSMHPTREPINRFLQSVGHRMTEKKGHAITDLDTLRGGLSALSKDQRGILVANFPSSPLVKLADESGWTNFGVWSRLRLHQEVVPGPLRNLLSRWTAASDWLRDGDCAQEWDEHADADTELHDLEPIDAKTVRVYLKGPVRSQSWKVFESIGHPKSLISLSEATEIGAFLWDHAADSIMGPVFGNPPCEISTMPPAIKLHPTHAHLLPEGYKRITVDVLAGYVLQALLNLQEPPYEKIRYLAWRMELESCWKTPLPADFPVHRVLFSDENYVTVNENTNNRMSKRGLPFLESLIGNWEDLKGRISHTGVVVDSTMTDQSDGWVTIATAINQWLVESPASEFTDWRSHAEVLIGGSVRSPIVFGLSGRLVARHQAIVYSEAAWDCLSKEGKSSRVSAYLVAPSPQFVDLIGFPGADPLHDWTMEHYELYAQYDYGGAMQRYDREVDRVFCDWLSIMRRPDEIQVVLPEQPPENVLEALHILFPDTVATVATHCHTLLKLFHVTPRLQHLAQGINEIDPMWVSFRWAEISTAANWLCGLKEYRKMLGEHHSRGEYFRVVPLGNRLYALGEIFARPSLVYLGIVARAAGQAVIPDGLEVWEEDFFGVRGSSKRYTKQDFQKALHQLYGHGTAPPVEVRRAVWSALIGLESYDDLAISATYEIVETRDGDFACAPLVEQGAYAQLLDGTGCKISTTARFPVGLRKALGLPPDSPDVRRLAVAVQAIAMDTAAKNRPGRLKEAMQLISGQWERFSPDRNYLRFVLEKIGNVPCVVVKGVPTLPPKVLFSTEPKCRAYQPPCRLSPPFLLALGARELDTVLAAFPAAPPIAKPPAPYPVPVVTHQMQEIPNDMQQWLIDGAPSVKVHLNMGASEAFCLLHRERLLMETTSSDGLIARALFKDALTATLTLPRIDSRAVEILQALVRVVYAPKEAQVRETMGALSLVDLAGLIRLLYDWQLARYVPHALETAAPLLLAENHECAELFLDTVDIGDLRTSHTKQYECLDRIRDEIAGQPVENAAGAAEGGA
eukprot:comp22763_c0_seq1/m.35565 comp22763_c0_seq1/g.35565  ORF comp22763_c0_seq1/g.35565 comp22763_c0_seq1/m.35565 type:complete len:1557 (-) comp22763_c0_seq1:650-5320(-)